MHCGALLFALIQRLRSCKQIFGGAHLAPLADIHVLSLSTLPWQWKQLTWKGPQPAPRYGHTACVYRSVIYVFGGTTKVREAEFLEARKKNIYI